MHRGREGGVDTTTSRRAAVLLGALALCGGITGCTDANEGSRAVTSTTAANETTGLPVDPLPDDSLVAVCLTEAEDDPIPTELCTVELTGMRSLLGTLVDSGQPIALSPDRTTVAAIVDGNLHLVAVDGSGTEDTGVAGSSPEWITEGSIGLVAVDGTGIVAVDSETFEVEPFADLAGLALREGFVVDSFTFSRRPGGLVAALFADRGPEGPDEDDLWALAALGVGGSEPRLLLEPSGTSLSHPDWSPDGRLAVVVELDVHLVDPDTGDTELVSPEQFQAVTPVWSADGDRLAWLANGVGSSLGPAILVWADASEAPFEPMPIVGNERRPLDEFPAFPDW